MHDKAEQAFNRSIKSKLQVKLKYTLQPAMKAQTGSKCVPVYSFFNLGAR
jgi:hypothetical protein